jgi:hypothetical protein
MSQFISGLLLFCFFFAQIMPLYSVEDIYKLTEVYTPKTYELEESRKICFFPFREKKVDDTPSQPSSQDYLSRGIPAILVTEIRKIGHIYDDNIIANVIRHPMNLDAKKPKKTKEKSTSLRALDQGGLSGASRRKILYSADDLDEIISGKKSLLPLSDPRYIPLVVEFFREHSFSPEPEDAFRLGSEKNCSYVVTGEYHKTGEDSLVSQYELTYLWNGKVVKNSYTSSFIRAFQELNPLAEKLRKNLIQKEMSKLSVDSEDQTGALVFLDGVYIGKTPILDFPITVGKHEILVTKKDLSEYYQAFEVSRSQAKKISAKLTANPRTSYLTVHSEPEGADVYLGIEKIGTTPLIRAKVPPGKNRLRVGKEEYIDHFTGVSLAVGKEHKENIVLRPGDTEIYYLNKNYVFLDYDYKDFATYSLFASLIFYAGHAYYQMRANRAIDSLRPEIQILNLSQFQNFYFASPNLAVAAVLYEEQKIRKIKDEARNYRRISGDLGMDRQGGKFQGGLMIYGMGLMIITSLSFFLLGIDKESFDIGFDPGTGKQSSPFQVDNSEARGHFQYNFRF